MWSCSSSCSYVLHLFEGPFFEHSSHIWDQWQARMSVLTKIKSSGMCLRRKCQSEDLLRRNMDKHTLYLHLKLMTSSIFRWKHLLINQSTSKQHVSGIKWAHYYIEVFKLLMCKQIGCRHCVASTERAKKKKGGGGQINPQPIRLHDNSLFPSKGILTCSELDLMEVKSGRLAIHTYYGAGQRCRRPLLIDIQCCKIHMVQNSPLFKMVKFN